MSLSRWNNLHPIVWCISIIPTTSCAVARDAITWRFCQSKVLIKPSRENHRNLYPPHRLHDIRIGSGSNNARPCVAHEGHSISRIENLKISLAPNVREMIKYDSYDRHQKRKGAPCVRYSKHLFPALPQCAPNQSPFHPHAHFQTKPTNP